MGQQQYVTNRKKVEFASALPFGKIIDQKTSQLSVGPSGINQLNFGHSFKTTPSIFGWGRIAGDNKWFPLLTTDEYTGDEFGSVTKKVYIKPYTSANSWGVYVKNRDSGASYTIDVKLWLYIA